MATPRWRLALAAPWLTLALEPNPPTWPPTVQVFGPETPLADIQARVQAAYAKNGGQVPDDHGQFSSERFAFLFKPGSYAVDVPVGYYTQVAGLGKSPTDVRFTSDKGVYCEESSYSISPGALNTFWRAAENFQSDANYEWNNNGLGGMLWAASQASSLRRLVVTNNLQLYQYRNGDAAAGFASGGFLANSIVKETVASGSQQQFLARHSQVGRWMDGVWNMVFVGVEGAPESHCSADPSMCSHPYLNVETGRTVMEKPFISFDPKAEKYFLNIPGVSSAGRTGAEFSAERQVDFSLVYVARADTDTAASINAKLAEGLHVVLTPGIYNLESSLALDTRGQVLLGMGLATLIPTSGEPAIRVGDVDGVQVASLLIQAGTQPTSSLLVWGTGKHKGSAKAPGAMHDVFVRVGGPATTEQVQADVMLTINSGHVIGDNFWLWRADHTESGLVYGGANPSYNALVVNGDDVTLYGLKAEHALRDLVVWNGERGANYFFQAELPYDVTQDYGDAGYVAYRINSTIQEHEAYGVGVYHYFRDSPVTVQTAIVAPPALESSVVAPLAVFLNGLGKVQHILNDKGAATYKQSTSGAYPQWICPAVQVPDFLGLLAMPACQVGDPVLCPGTTIGCKGNTCCPDGSTCPSASKDFGCCPAPKKEDCTSGGGTTTSTTTTTSSGPSPPPPHGPTTTTTTTTTTATQQTCKVGDTVKCPGSSMNCAGDQCCSDGSICPSADESFKGCLHGKTVDCVPHSFLQEVLV